MSDNQDSGTPFGGAILAILGVAIGVALLQAGSSDEGSGYSGVKSAATREDTPRRTLPIRMQGSAVPDAADEVVDEELAEIPAEVAQKPDSADNLRRGLLDFDCPVEPASATGQGRLRFVTWPGPDEFALPGDPFMLRPSRPKVSLADGRIRFAFKVWEKDVSEHHIVHEADLLVPGFEPTRVRLLGPGPEGPGRCLGGAIQLQVGGHGVVGTVTTHRGVPIPGAVVVGCGERALTDGDGSYFLMPTDEGACTVVARAAPGSMSSAEPVAIEPATDRDTVVDFRIFTPSVRELGAQVVQSGTARFLRVTHPDSPWAPAFAHSGDVEILQVGEVDATELTDEQVMDALYTLEVPIRFQSRMETEGGRKVILREVVSEL